jgi:hypothetical protein
LETAEKVRYEVSYILRHTKPQKQTTGKAEQEPPRALGKDESITILTADKGSMKVVLLKISTIK